MTTTDEGPPPLISNSDEKDGKLFNDSDTPQDMMKWFVSEEKVLSDLFINEDIDFNLMIQLKNTLQVIVESTLTNQIALLDTYDQSDSIDCSTFLEQRWTPFLQSLDDKYQFCVGKVVEFQTRQLEASRDLIDTCRDTLKTCNLEDDKSFLVVKNHLINISKGCM